MAYKKRNKKFNESTYDFPRDRWLNAIIDTFILNLFRICKSALYLEVDSIAHFIFDCICLAIPLIVMYFLKWWYGYYVIFGLIGLCLIAGISVKSGQNVKDKKRMHYIMTQDKIDEPSEDDTPNISPDDELDMPPEITPDGIDINKLGNVETIVLSNNNLKKFDPFVWDVTRKWLQSNPKGFAIDSEKYTHGK